LVFLRSSHSVELGPGAQPVEVGGVPVSAGSAATRGLDEDAGVDQRRHRLRPIRGDDREETSGAGHSRCSLARNAASGYREQPMRVHADEVFRER
jgi:hypothetical protein